MELDPQALADLEIALEIQDRVADHLECVGEFSLAGVIADADARMEMGAVRFLFKTEAAFGYADRARVLIADALCVVADYLVPLKLIRVQ